MAVTSRHNKYSSIPDWFGTTSTETATTPSTGSTTTTYITSGGGSGTPSDYSNIPIDKQTIIWNNELLSVPIDNDTIILENGLLTVPNNVTSVWELKQLADGTEYIYTTYPVVTQLGITMYGGADDLDVSGIYDGLPIDGDTIYWSADENGNRILRAKGGSESGGVSDFWALSNIPSWITTTKPSYSYSEINNTPDLTDYATQTWVNSQGFLTTHQTIYELTLQPGVFTSSSFTANAAAKTINIPTTTSHISEGSRLYFTNARAISALTDTLAKYVTLAGSQTITGEKNFTGGLNVNGSPIVYDSTNKYWKLEGDLLVTGGVTAYGDDADFTPSTIMDALVVDNTTLKVVDGVLKFVGSVDGGVASSVAWSDITGKPSWITTSTPSITISGTSVALGGSITQSALRTALGLGSNAYSSTAYLPLSGGTMTGAIIMGTNKYIYGGSNVSGQAMLYFNGTKTVLGSIGESTTEATHIRSITGHATIGTSSAATYTIWDSGNHGSGSGLDADLLDGLHVNKSNTPFNTIPCVKADGVMEVGAYMDFHLDNTTNSDYSTRLQVTGNYSNTVSLPSSTGTLALTTSNVASATKLQTARSIWGQSFDGTADITGRLLLPNNTALSSLMTDGTECRLMYLNTSNLLSIGYDGARNGCTTKLNGNVIQFAYGTTPTFGMILNSSGNLTIGASDLASTSVKLYVSGATKTTGNLIFGGEMYRPIPSGGTYKPFRIIQTTDYALIQVSSYDGTSANGVLQLAGGLNGSLSQFKVLAGTSYISGKLGLGVSAPTEKLHVAGNILATGGVTVYSMRALKNVVDERGLSLEELSAIKPTRYKWKDGRDNRLHFGGIADDVEKVLPEVVYKTHDGVLTMDYGNAAFAIASSLIKPIISHEQRIADLEAENKRLKEQIEILKNN